MTGILNGIILTMLFVIFGGLFDDIISLRMSQRRIPGLLLLSKKYISVLFHRFSTRNLFALLPLILSAIIIPPYNGYSVVNFACMNILLLFLAIPMSGGYLAYSNSNQISARKFNIETLSYFINILSLFVLYLVLFQKTMVNDINGLIFIQQGGHSEWLFAKQPLLGILTALSLYSACGFSPFTGFSGRTISHLLYKKENSKLSLLAFVYLYRYILFAFFIDAYLGGAGSAVYMFLKIAFINAVFSSISMLFPKMNLKENIVFNIVIIFTGVLYAVISGVLL